MLATRIIPCLDVDHGRVVKGIQFKGIRDAGDPVERAREYNQQGADEIAFLDIGASPGSRKILIDVVEKVSSQVFVPMTVGGGVRSIDDIRLLLRAGADKVAICTSALRNPGLLSRGARRFGAQCLVLSIDAKKCGSSWRAYMNGGRRNSGRDVLEWAIEGERMGAGEILLNSMDCDGTRQGYDLELTRLISESVNIPVIASGGAGTPDQIWEAVNTGKAQAVLLASLLHYREMEIPDIKIFIQKKGGVVRW